MRCSASLAGLARSGGSLAGLETCGSTYFVRSSAQSLLAGGSIIIGPFGSASLLGRILTSIKDADCDPVVGIMRCVLQAWFSSPSDLGHQKFGGLSF